MIYIWVDTDGYVSRELHSIVQIPEDQLAAALAGSIAVESVPVEPQAPIGKYNRLKYVDGVFSHEEFDLPGGVPEPDILQELANVKAKQELMQAALDDLILGGAL